MKIETEPLPRPGRDVGFLVGGRLVSAVAQSVMVLWLVTIESPGQVGFLLTWFSIALIFSGATDFGFTTMILLAMKTSWPRAKSLLGADTFVSTVLAAFIVTTACAVIALAKSPAFVGLVISAGLMLLWALFETLTEAGNMVQLGRNQSALAGVAIAMRRILALGLYGAFVTLGLRDFAFPVALLGGAAVVYIFLPKAWSWPRVFTKGLLLELRPYAIMSAVGQLRNFDVPLMASVFGATRSAPYALGARLANPVLILAGSVGNVLVARRKHIRVSQLGLVILAGSGLLGMVLAVSPFAAPIIASFAQPYVSWLNGPNVYVALVVFCRFLMVALTMVLSSTLVSMAKVTYAARVNVVFALIASGTILIVGLGTNQILVTLFASISIYVFQVAALGVAALSGARRDVHDV